MNERQTNTVAQLLQDSKLTGGLSLEAISKIQDLWNNLKTQPSAKECSIISAEFGKFGHIEIFDVSRFEQGDYQLKYLSRNYDYVAISSKKETCILWTDYQDIQPYNRQSCFYVGRSFQTLGEPKVKKEDYREFYFESKKLQSMSLPVWGFQHNKTYDEVKFGMCIETQNVDLFISELRKILEK
jgi:hypothetical protein